MVVLIKSIGKFLFLLFLSSCLSNVRFFPDIENAFDDDSVQPEMSPVDSLHAGYYRTVRNRQYRDSERHLTLKVLTIQVLNDYRVAVSILLHNDIAGSPITQISLTQNTFLEDQVLTRFGCENLYSLTGQPCLIRPDMPYEIIFSRVPSHTEWVNFNAELAILQPSDPYNPLFLSVRFENISFQ